MCGTQLVLELAVLYVGFAHSWDLAITHGDLLEFYTNDTKTRSVRLNSHNLGALAYDEVHNMLLYVDKQSDNDAICAHDISSQVNQCFIERNGRNIHGLSFDPATELLFFSDTNERSINWISLESGANKYGNLLIKMDHGIPTDVAVDSCRGYVYWINTNLTTPTIERARFNGSDREVIININSFSINTTYKLEPHSLNIDHQTQKLYWMEPTTSSKYKIFYADLNGQNRNHETILNLSNKFTNPSSNRLTLSKTNLFVTSWCSDCTAVSVFRCGKTEYIEAKHLHLSPIINDNFSSVANYKIKEQIQDVKDCDALMSLEQKISVGPFCVHGVKVIGQSLCKCAPGYIGERCDLSICENYCLQGNCSVNDEGLPKCRCNDGYSGERCGNSDWLYCVNGVKVNGQSLCKCAPGYIGERCDLSICENYCFQGNCSVNDEGLPTCRCNAGYSGERCEVNSCHGYCLNNGVCSLNEEDEPSCECVGGYRGLKCEVFQSVTFTFSNHPAYSGETNPTLIDLLSNVRKNTSKIFFIVDES